MKKNDWYEAGDQIKKLVQDAIDRKDFSQLSNTISNVVNQTVDGLQSAIKENIGEAGQWRQTRTGTDSRQWNREYADEEAGDWRYADDERSAYERAEENSRQGRYGQQDTSARQRWYERTNAQAAERIRNTVRQKKQNAANNVRPPKPVKAKLKVPGEISGRVMKWFGYSTGSMLGLALAILGVVGISSGAYVAIPVGILAILFGTTLSIGIGGSRRLGLAKRFRRYHEILGERSYCLIEELASSVGQSYKFVRKDIKKMIRKGFFTEGHLDRKETLLITDRETYQQYLQTQAEYERRGVVEMNQAPRASAGEEAAQQTQAGQEAGEKKENGLTPECRELIEEGKRYIQHIHECNEKIPGENMSAKLDRLELVITRIFREVEKDPSVVDDLKKLMSYYLPTTRKLLDAYCDLDSQPIRGQNIESMKKEIEDALDTINAAFENLLDGFFEEKAWDISSDISVLHTMLAQEGLTGNDFGKGPAGQEK